MKLINQNVKGFPPMSKAKVRHDVRLTLADAGEGGVIFWQEFYSYGWALRELSDQWAHFLPEGPGHNVPITWWAEHWQLLDSGVAFLHPGHRFITPRQHITWVMLRNRTTGRIGVFTNRHYLPGAFADTRKPWARWRARTWAMAVQCDMALIAGFIAKGYPVAGGGDYNLRAVHGTPYGSLIHAPGPEGGTTRHVTYHPEAGSGVCWLWTISSPGLYWASLATSPPVALDGRYSDHAGRCVGLLLRPRGA